MNANSTTLQSGERRSVFVTGANGYIGSAVCRAFVRAGWRTFGLVRRAEAKKDPITAEIIPVIGSFTDLTFVDALHEQGNTFDVIVSCTEQVLDYATHFGEIVALLKALAGQRNGLKPLVLFSSGCKDYGTTGIHGASDLLPHTEEFPLNPPPVIQDRATYSTTIFDYTDYFHAALIRPTGVFGYSSSFYGPILSWASAEASVGIDTLQIPADPNSIMHATHVDDCAEAYLALAECTDRSAVAGQVFNISGHRYETTREIGVALAKEYGFKGGVEFVSADEAGPSYPGGLNFLFGFSQWVDSGKIRRLTGWSDNRALFLEDLPVYRRAYEAAEADENSNVAAAKGLIFGTFASEQPS